MFTPDNFNLDAFCHSLHVQERAAQRLENMKPVRVRTWREKQSEEAAAAGVDRRNSVRNLYIPGAYGGV